MVAPREPVSRLMAMVRAGGEKRQAWCCTPGSPWWAAPLPLGGSIIVSGYGGYMHSPGSLQVVIFLPRESPNTQQHEPDRRTDQNEQRRRAADGQEHG